MLTGGMTTWIRLRPAPEADGTGGTVRQWHAEGMFQGRVTQEMGRETAPGGVPALRTRGVLMHRPGVSLTLGDRVMEVAGGAIWRVCGNSGDMTAARFAGVGVAMVPVERVVNGG